MTCSSQVYRISILWFICHYCQVDNYCRTVRTRSIIILTHFQDSMNLSLTMIGLRSWYSLVRLGFKQKEAQYLVTTTFSLVKLQTEYRYQKTTDDVSVLLFAMHSLVKSYRVPKQDIVLSLTILSLVQEVRQRTNMTEKHCCCSSWNSKRPLNKSWTSTSAPLTTANLHHWRLLQPLQISTFNIRINNKWQWNSSAQFRSNKDVLLGTTCCFLC